VKSYALAGLISLLLLVVTIRAIRKRQLTEALAILWLFVSGATVVLSVLLPLGAFNSLAKAVGIAYPPDMVLVFGMLFLFLFSFQLSVAMSRHKARQKTLVQEMALMKARLESRDDL
jgi:hypothetical protein